MGAPQQALLGVGGGITYADMAAYESAKAGGATFADGAIITLTATSADWVYFTALDTAGANGLIPKDPLQTSAAISAVVVGESHTATSNPTTWGYTNGSTGTNGLDYVINATSGQNKMAKLNSTGRPFMYNSAPSSSDTATFMIIDAVTIAQPDNFSGVAIQLGCYNGGSNIKRASIYGGTNSSWGTTTKFGFRLADGPGFTLADLGITYGTATRFWIFCTPSKNSVWTDTGLLLATTSVPPTSTTQVNNLFLVGNTPDGLNLSDLRFGHMLRGRMTL